METLDLKDIEPLKNEDIEITKVPSKLESTLRGGAQGLTLGFADELTGLGESALGSLGFVEDKTYEQARDEARLANKLAKEANPKAYLLGELGGGLAGAVVPGVGALGAGKSLGSAVKAGAAMGGLAGLGSSEGDVATQAVDTLKGAALGGAVGGVVGKVGEKVGKAVDAYKGSKLRELIQKGEKIDDPVIAQRITDEISKELGGKLSSTPRQLIEGRDKIVNQALSKSKLPTPKAEGAFDVIQPKPIEIEPDISLLLGSPPPKPSYTPIIVPDVQGSISRLRADFSNQPKVKGTLRDITELLKKPDLNATEYKELDSLLHSLQGKDLTGQFEDKLIKFAKPIQEDLKKGLPKEWHEANQLYHKYLSEVVEPSVLDKGKFSRVGAEKTEAKAQDVLAELLEGIKTGDKESLYKLEKLKSGLESFDKRSPGLLTETSGLDASSLGEKISEGAKTISALGEYQAPLKSPGLIEMASVATGHPIAALGKFALRNKLGAKTVGATAKAEKWASDTFQSGMQQIKDYTPEMLTEKAQALMQNEKLAKLGQYLLDAVKTNNIAKKNAAMFSALQNPQARAIVMPAKAEQEQE